MSDEDIMWDLLEKVLEHGYSIEKARYILAGSGQLADFDWYLKEFQSE